MNRNQLRLSYRSLKRGRRTSSAFASRSRIHPSVPLRDVGSNTYMTDSEVLGVGTGVCDVRGDPWIPEFSQTWKTQLVQGRTRVPVVPQALPAWAGDPGPTLLQVIPRLENFRV